jgi:hypothetical protein
MKGRKMIDAIRTAPPTSAGRPIPNFPLLTEALGGGLRGITVIGGPTKHGKSRLTANLVANIGGPELPVLYVDRENDDQVDDDGRPITRTVGDWIIEAYGAACPALQTLYGYHSFADLKDDLQSFAPPACIVLDTVQSIVGHAGEHMRTEMVALVEWTKERVRHGYMVVLVSQVNGFGEFKESKALAEGGWSALMLTKKGSAIEVRVGDIRQAAITSKGVLMQMDGARISEVRKLGTTVQNEKGERLTTLQRIIEGQGGRMSFEALKRARGYRGARNSAAEKRARREFNQAARTGEIGHPERGVYTYPAADKPADSVSAEVSAMSAA